jgi:hypothetical protein
MRNTSRGLSEGKRIRVVNPDSRRYAHGRVVSIHGELLQYRSDYNLGVYLTRVAQCRVVQPRRRRFKTAA